MAHLLFFLESTYSLRVESQKRIYSMPTSACLRPLKTEKALASLSRVVHGYYYVVREGRG